MNGMSMMVFLGRVVQYKGFSKVPLLTMFERQGMIRSVLTTGEGSP
mgnify:CR=1|jgi:hypothetical protein